MDPAREIDWQRKLRPIRVGAEPILDQLRRRFQAMLLMTGLTSMIALMMLAIFAGFGRPDVGLGVAGLIVLPVTSWIWLDYLLLRSRTFAYWRERENEAPPS